MSGSTHRSSGLVADPCGPGPGRPGPGSGGLSQGPLAGALQPALRGLRVHQLGHLRGGRALPALRAAGSPATPGPRPGSFCGCEFPPAAACHPEGTWAGGRETVDSAARGTPVARPQRPGPRGPQCPGGSSRGTGASTPQPDLHLTPRDQRPPLCGAAGKDVATSGCLCPQGRAARLSPSLWELRGAASPLLGCPHPTREAASLSPADPSP